MDAFVSSQLGFPTPIVLQEVFQSWKPDVAKFEGLKKCPITPWPVEDIRWDMKGPISGLAAPNVPGTRPKARTVPPVKTLHIPTMNWADEISFDQSVFLRIRQMGTIDKLAGEKEVMWALQQLSLLQYSRVEWAIWQMITAGQYTINENGVVRTCDSGVLDPIIDVTDNAGVAWNNPAAKIIEDIQHATEAFFGVTDTIPELWLNAYDVKWLAQNAEFRDLIKRSAFVVKTGRDSLNAIYPELIGGLEGLYTYKGGYLTDAFVYQPFIPLGSAVLIAQPPMGQRLMEFRSTPDTRNGGAANPQTGMWLVVEDNSSKILPQYNMAAGINGQPVIFFPRCIQRLSIYPTDGPGYVGENVTRGAVGP